MLLICLLMICLFLICLLFTFFTVTWHHADAWIPISAVSVMLKELAFQFNRLRKTMIELVLATDMKQHFVITSHFNTVHRLGVASGTVGQRR